MYSARYFKRLRDFGLAGLGLCALAVHAHAATFCVSTVGGLQDALNTAQDNGESNTIKVHIGTYPVPLGGFTYFTSANYGLDLEGGWASLQTGQCDLQGTSANLTVFDGQNQTAILHIEAGGTGDITLRYLTLQNGYGNASALTLRANTTGVVRVTNSLFRGNHAVDEVYANPVADVSSIQGIVHFTDNALVDNRDGDETLRIVSGDVDDTIAIYINNNTIAGNTNPAGSPQTALRLSQPPCGAVSMSNNIVWNGSVDDGYVSCDMILANNDIDDLYTFPTVGVGNISADPRFIDPGNGNYRLPGNSIARDSGFNSPLGGARNYDLDGNARVVFGTIDIGAYEVQDTIFRDGFGD